MPKQIKFRVAIHEVHVSYREVIAEEGTPAKEIVKLALENLEAEVSIEYSNALADEHTVERIGKVDRRGTP